MNQNPLHYSSVKWLVDNRLKVERYIRRCHNRSDWENIKELIYEYPEDGIKIVKSFDYSNWEKLNLLCNYILLYPQITCGIIGDQRRGKDATICSIFETILEICKINKMANNIDMTPRIITLGNIQKPPFVKDEDMYFTMSNLPIGTRTNKVYVYSSEIEIVLPARETAGRENRLFSQLEGTFAQNGQKIFGCIKLLSKVDLNFIRGLNVKIFKYINADKLNIEGSEREGVLSGLGSWLLPKETDPIGDCLVVFGSTMFKLNIGLPSFWSDEYSEQFSNISDEKIIDFIQVQIENDMTPSAIRIQIQQKFRKDWSIERIQESVK